MLDEIDGVTEIVDEMTAEFYGIRTLRPSTDEPHVVG